MTWKRSDGRSLRGVLVRAAESGATGPPPAPTRTVGKRGPPISRPKDPKPVRSEAYMAFVREHPCVFASSSCYGPIEAHHHGKHPAGQKTDDARCVPLCTAHHMDVTGRPFPSSEPGRVVYVDQETSNAMTAAQVELLVEWFRKKEKM